MEARPERRRPDREAFVLRFLRRIAILALVIALALWGAPRVLVWMGLLGPTADQKIDEAAHAVAAARSYGATEALAPLIAAEQGLARARALAASGDERAARRAAQAGADSAIEAQKLALVARSEVRRKAEAVYNDLDREINDLEKLYDATVPGLEREQTAQLLSLMKVTRQSTGLLFLAYEKQDYGTVVEGEHRAREVIAQTRSRLKSAKR